jgi:hypothetical protein
MDVLHEIERSNGRSVALLQHQHTTVGQERDRYFVRGFNYGNPGECVSVYLTSEEVDRLTAERQQRSRVSQDNALVDSIFATLRGLKHTSRVRR